MNRKLKSPVSDSVFRLRVILAAGMLFLLIAWVIASQFMRLERESVVSEVATRISGFIAQAQIRLDYVISQAERDVRFFASTPPVAGISRSLANGGIDPQDNQTLAQWLTRLEQIVKAYIVAQPDIFQLRFIGLANDGRELVRVVRDTVGAIRVIGEDGLQNKGDRPYVSKALGLPEGEIYVSPIDLNIENGRIELPPRPTLRASMPVRTARGEVFGVVVINAQAKPILDFLGNSQGLPGLQAWVTDGAGHYLYHPRPGMAFAHLLNLPSATWQEEFTAAPDAVVPGGRAGADTAVLRAPDGRDWLVFTKTLREPEADGTGSTVLHLGIPMNVLDERVWKAAGRNIIQGWAMGLAIIGVLAILLLRWELLTRVESPMVSAANERSDRWPLFLGVGVVLLVLLLGAIGSKFLRTSELVTARAEARFRGELFNDTLHAAIRSAEHAARILMELHPENISSQADFERLAADLNGVTTQSLVLQWSPQCIVRFVQPLAGNESVIGLDLMALPRERKLIERSIATKQAIWDGPFPLRQGGIGMVYRLPVYRHSALGLEQDFLGLSTCLVNLTAIAENTATGFEAYDFLVSTESDFAAPLEVFRTSPRIEAAAGAVTDSSYVTEPSGSFESSGIRFTVTAALKTSPVYGSWMASGAIALVAAFSGWLAQLVENRRIGRRRLLDVSARLERSAQAAKVGFWEYTLATGRVTWSKELLEFRGITEREFDGTLPGMMQFTHPEDRELFDAPTHTARVDEPFSIEFRVMRPDGQVLWLESRGRLLGDASGQPVRFLGSEIDITARKTAELALREQVIERETLLQEVYHRVKNNLQVITSLLASQQRISSNPVVVSELQKSRDRIEAISLVHERLYAGKSLHSIDAQGYVRTLADGLIKVWGASDKCSVKHEGGSFNLSLREAVPFGLLVNELVTNALKHAFPGKRMGNITIRLGCEDDGMRHLVIEDDGVGLSPESSTRGSVSEVTEKFYSGERAFGPPTRSMGAQLIRLLVKQLQGNFESVKADVGTSFHLILQPKVTDKEGLW